MHITISPAARERMLDFLARQPGAAGIRFGVTSSGCSGHGYLVRVAEARQAGEDLLDIEGVPMLVDPRSSSMLDGTTIDFRHEGLSAGFVFDNPNATGECGCGESFSVTGGR